MEPTRPRNFREYPEQLEKPELIGILTTFAKKDNMLGRSLRGRQNLASENPEGVIGGIYSKLEPILKVVTCYNFYNMQYAKPERII